MPVLRNKKTGPGMMPGRLAACSLRGRKRALLKLDDGVQAVPGHACGQRAPRIKAGILANKDQIKTQIEAAKKAQSK